MSHPQAKKEKKIMLCLHPSCVCFIDKGNLVPCVQTVLPDQGPGSVSGV